MNTEILTPEVSGVPVRTTTKRREWWGWYGSMSWLFFMMYGYTAIFSGPLFAEGFEVLGSWLPFFFMLAFALSIAVFGWRCGRDPDKLAGIALYTTPVAVVMTALFAILPQPAGFALYIAAPVFMAPAITRRVFGVLRTSSPNRRLTRYMTGIIACIATFTAWMMIGLPLEIAFIVPALLALPAWIGIRRRVSLPENLAPGTRSAMPKRSAFLLVAAMATIFFMSLLHTVIHSYFLNTSIESSEIILTMLDLILPPAGFVLFAIIGDRGHDRTGFIYGMGLFLIGLLFTYFPDGAQIPVLIPLFIAHAFGGAYAEFTILTLPVFFLERTKRPVFIASLGVILNLLSSAAAWTMDIWMPAPLLRVGPPLVVSTAVVTVLFIVLGFILFERHRENSLAASLYALLHSDAGENKPVLMTGENGSSSETPAKKQPPLQETPDAHGIAQKQDAIQTQGMVDAGLTQKEIEIALLLIEGESKRDIARKFNMTTSDFSQHENDIRNKLNLIGERDPVVAAASAEYKLTKRETQMLRYLRRNMSNDEIAADMFLSEETIKSHVHNLLKKIPVEKRQDIPRWLETYET